MISTSTPEQEMSLQSQDVELDVRDLLLMLWRRRVLIVGIVLMGLSLAALVMSFIQPRYTSGTLLLINAGGSQQINQELGSLLTQSVIGLDTSLVLSEVEVLRSRMLARDVVQRLDLMRDPEFNLSFRVAGDVNTAFKALSVYDEELRSLPPAVVEQQIEEVVSRVLRGLKVRSIPGSYAVQLEFTSVNPGKAALIANTFVDAYIEQRLARKFETSRKVTSWLDKRLAVLRSQLRAAEDAVQQYKREHNIVEGTRSVMSGEQVSGLSSELVVAQTQLADAQARLEQAKRLEQNGGVSDAVPEVVNSHLISQLKINQGKLEQSLSELSKRYGPKHPKIKKLTSELTEARRSMAAEISNITQSIESEVVFARSRVEALNAELDNVSGRRMDDNQAMSGLLGLQREAELTRLIFDAFLETYKRSDDQDDLQESQARVLSYASAAAEPSFPNKPLLLGLSGVLSLFFALILTVSLEKFDNTFRSASQLETYLGMPCYGLIPEAKADPGTLMADYVLSKPASMLAEAVRTLRTVLNLRANKPKVVTMSSSFPGEGKTALSVWMARLAAKSGEKVILIDCDLRRPNVHKTLGRDNAVSLVEYLTDKNTLEDIVQKDDATGLHMIYARSVPNSALDLINSSRLSALIESLRQVYDLVILDSPPSLAVSDARVLAQMSDHVFYAVGWNATPRDVVHSGVKQFYDMGYTKVSTVLTLVDVARHVGYGYGDAVYYYGRNQDYYKDT